MLLLYAFVVEMARNVLREFPVGIAVINEICYDEDSMKATPTRNQVCEPFWGFRESWRKRPAQNYRQ